MRNPSGKVTPLSWLPLPTTSSYPQAQMCPCGSSCPKPPALLNNWRVCFSSESACDCHGEQRRKARACGCALLGQAWPPFLLSSRLAALVEMETLAHTVPVLPISTRRRKQFPKRLQLLPHTQSQPQTSPHRRHLKTEAGARSGTSPMAPAKLCLHQLQGQKWQKQRLGDLHSEKHST